MNLNLLLLNNKQHKPLTIVDRLREVLLYKYKYQCSV